MSAEGQEKARKAVRLRLDCRILSAEVQPNGYGNFDNRSVGR